MANEVPDPAAKPLSDALSYEGALSLNWTALATPPDANLLERYNEDNLRVLAAVALLDEQRCPNNGSDEANTVEGEIARLHQKMNLLVDLLAFLVAQHAPPPPLRPVRLSWQGLSWRDQPAWGAGLVSLRLHRSVPQPFVWPARIVHAANGELHARFEPFGEACQAALERHVFLHHRRAIAGHRRPAS